MRTYSNMLMLICKLADLIMTLMTLSLVQRSRHYSVPASSSRHSIQKSGFLAVCVKLVELSYSQVTKRDH